MEISTGQRFERWEVLTPDPTSTNRHPKFLCRCNCGKEKSVRKDHLLNGVSAYNKAAIKHFGEHALLNFKEN